jgi:IS30 family transposase
MTYCQLTSSERYMLAALRRQGLNNSEIARSLGRHRSTVCRELGCNSTQADGRFWLLSRILPRIAPRRWPVILCSDP